jgi:hypothetical protein
MSSTEQADQAPTGTATKSKRKRQKRVIFSRTEEVPINSIIPYHKNARRGDINTIAQSLRENGQYKPLIVNIGTKTNRFKEILAGNHTWLAAKQEGWTKIGVAWVDVDNPEAAKINLIDNRANDMATYDVDVLAEQLRDLPTLSGTGYSDDDAQAIIASIDTGDIEAAIEVMRPVSDVAAVEDPFDDVVDVEGGGEYQPLDWEEEGVDFRHDVSEQLGGVVQLGTDLNYEFLGDWHIPVWRTDVLVRPEDLPEKLAAWAGSATKYDPEKDWPEEDQWWLYNFGIDSTSGMRDISKMIMAFFCFDDYWECWWDYPDRYTTKLINSGVTMAVAPDFSTWTSQPRIQSFWNTHRSRWLGRYFQEAGVNLIPTFEWPQGDLWFMQHCVLDTLPKGATYPLIALQRNTGLDEDDDTLDDLAEQYHLLIDRVQPEMVLLYASPQGLEFWESLGISTPVRYVEQRMQALANQAKRRAKKTTL